MIKNVYRICTVLAVSLLLVTGSIGVSAMNVEQSGSNIKVSGTSTAQKTTVVVKSPDFDSVGLSDGICYFDEASVTEGSYSYEFTLTEKGNHVINIQHLDLFQTGEVSEVYTLGDYPLTSFDYNTDTSLSGMATFDYKPESCVVISALYKNDVLIDIETSDVYDENTKSITASLDKPSDFETGGYKLKTFMWNNLAEGSPIVASITVDKTAAQE